MVLEKFVAKGANKLDDLRNKILTKFGFKKLWLEKHGAHIQLWGEFNPKVLLMDEDGNVTSKDLTPDELLEIKNRRLDNKVIGEKLDNGGIVVSDSYAKDFMDGKSKKTFDDLNKMDAVDIRKLSGNLDGTRELRNGIPGQQPKDFQAHHIIPRQLEATFRSFFDDIGFNIENGAINGIMVPPNADALKIAKLDPTIPIGNQFDNCATHLGSHRNYTDRIRLKIEKIELDLNMKKITSQQALEKVVALTDNAKTAIKTGKGKIIDDIIF